MKQVQISVLKSQLSKHLRAAEAGETIEIMDRARPIAHVGPVTPSGQLETVPSDRPFSEVRRVRLPRLGSRVSSLDVLIDERGTR
jgi:antitoxin (DNA-binding transcriptional repressor) of toxin-antitoxin stability system